MPTAITFAILLMACSYAGLVQDDQIRFITMSYITLASEHHVFMLDLFICIEHFDKAIGMIDKVPFSDCLQLRLVLLSACQHWVNVDLGRWACEHAIHLHENYDASHVCMNNIFVAASMQSKRKKSE